MIYANAAITAVVWVFATLPFLNFAQLEGYKLKLGKKAVRLYTRYLAAAAVSAALFFVFLSFYKTQQNTAFLAAAISAALAVKAGVGVWQFLQKRKKPLVYTPRVIRLIVTQLLAAFLLLVVLLIIGRAIGEHYTYILLVLPFFFTPYLTFAAVIVNAPFERLIARRYIKKTAEFFATRGDLIKIGITGSFGKTSVKFILEKMMLKRYRTVCTPASFNTPMGMARSVALIEPDTEVFIAEMGARYMGNIKELCEIVRPGFAILTAVAGQHLETMGSIENIYKTKYELVEALPKSGFCVFNGDNAYTVKMYNSCRCGKALASLNRGDCVATDIEVTEHGSSFRLHAGGKSVEAHTALVGRHNILNITMAACMAYKLGVSLSDIAKACAELEAVPHRLQVIRLDNGVTILDDSYNGNREGILMGLETLNMFSGRKIIATPGVVELGDAEQEVLTELGAAAAGVVELAFLIGPGAGYLRTGMLGAGFDERNIYMCASLAEAQRHFEHVLGAGDVVLIANDLPDNY